MKILALETSGEPASVALLEGDRLLAQRTFPSRMALCRTLPGHIGEALSDAGLSSLDKVDALAVSLGPGSFTSLRVGVALAKAAAHALHRPLVGVPTHDVLALGVLRAMGESLAPDSMICVVQSARREDVYTTGYTVQGASVTPLGPCEVCGLQQVLDRLQAKQTPVVLVGDAVVLHRDKLLAHNPGGHVTLGSDDLHAPRAEFVAALAQPQLAAADPSAAFGLRPIYVLASQAERSQGIDLGLS